MYLSNEFDGQSGRYTVDAELNGVEISKIKANRLSIIDSKVFNSNLVNVALPKNDFADYVFNSASGFDDFSFAEFGKILEVVSEIVTESTRSPRQADIGVV